MNRSLWDARLGRRLVAVAGVLAVAAARPASGDGSAPAAAPTLAVNAPAAPAAVAEIADSGSAAPVAAPQEPTFDLATLKPYFAGTTLEHVADEIHEGPAGALQALKKLPATSKELPIRFLRAEALAATNDDASAARLFEEIADQYPPMSARCHCLAAAAFERIGDLTQAVVNYGPCADDPVRGRLAPISKARILARLHKVDDALASLDEASPKVHVEALAARAAILADAGRRKAALESYRQLYYDEPLASASEHAREHIRDLASKLKVPAAPMDLLAARVWKLLEGKKTREAIAEARELPSKPLCTGKTCAPRRCTLAPEPPLVEDTVAEDALDSTESEELLPELTPAKPARAFSVAKAHDPDERGPLADPVLPKCAVVAPKKPADKVSCAAQLTRGWIEKVQKHYAKALELLRPVYEQCADPQMRVLALNLSSSAAAKIGDADALPLALILAYQFPDDPLADDALMSAANLAREAGDGRTERAALRRLATKYPDSDQRADAVFRLFWSYRSEGRPDRGLAHLETLWKDYDISHGDGADADRGRYWWGRTVATSAIKADRPKGVEMLVTLMRNRALSYYGLLARSFVAAVDPKAVVAPAPVEPYPGQLRIGLLANDRAFLEGVELLRMGDEGQAHEAFWSVDFKALRKDGRRGAESGLLVAEIFSHMGDTRLAHAIARRDLLATIRDGTDPLGRRAALICYPLAYREPVWTNATKQGYSPDFLQGLMREESALDPHAHSPVGARGLTQLMPHTAKLVAKSLGLKRFRTDSLWEPDTNIEIGSVYLGRMLKHFGHMGLAAAAYNAGPQAVDRWLDGPPVAFDEFVEDIPFSETRGYVKRVLRSFAAYQYLYDATSPAARVSMSLRPILSTPN